ncbi:MAG TPA: SWIM zinc finger family protein [Armatimonadota bacterium]|nr:SWIM zinc finger family protein [Armatimonadota bacterium]
MNNRIQEHNKRRLTAQQMRGEYCIEPLEDGRYRVQKKDGTFYLVDLDAETCTCADFQRRLSRHREYAGVWCKHMHLCAASFLR